MKHFFYLLILLLSTSNVFAQFTSEGFEGPCSSNSDPFPTGCITDWISLSGTADIYSTQIPPLEGRYVHMYSEYDGTCNKPTRGESIALNYNFEAGETYTITYSLAWKDFANCYLDSEWILTNGRTPQATGGGCSEGEVLPLIDSSDEVVWSEGLVGIQTTWQERSITFTPNSNYSQLWFRNETSVTNGSNNQFMNRVYLDKCVLSPCSTTGYTTNFSLSAIPKNGFSVLATTVAFPTPTPVYHEWDVFYAPFGNTSGNQQVPGNPLQWGQSASFSNNLYIKQWYYIKHGIWDDNCITWREKRKRFRVQLVKPGDGFGAKEYVLEVENVAFEPSDEYITEMGQKARAGELSKNSDLNKLLGDLHDLSNTSKMSKASIDKLNSLSNAPNPFSTSTDIMFSLNDKAEVSLFVSDINGKKIAIPLDQKMMNAGNHKITFDGSNYTTGIYFYTIIIGDTIETKKMILHR